MFIGTRNGHVTVAARVDLDDLDDLDEPDQLAELMTVLAHRADSSDVLTVSHGTGPRPST